MPKSKGPPPERNDASRPPGNRTDPTVEEMLVTAWTHQSARLTDLASQLEILAVIGEHLTRENRLFESDLAHLVAFQRTRERAGEATAALFQSTRDLMAASEQEVPEGAPRRVVALRRTAEDAVDRIRVAWRRIGPSDFGAEMGERFADQSGAEVDKALRDFFVWAPSDEDRAALRHVLIRPPRRGPDARWRTVMRQSTPEGFARWLNKAVRGAVRDQGRPRKRQRQIVGTEEDVRCLLANLPGDPGFTDAERNVLISSLAGRSSTDIAAERRTNAKTVRTLRSRAKKKLRAVLDRLP